MTESLSPSADGGIRGRALLSPVFLIAAGVFVVAGFGLEPVLQRLEARYRKEPIAIRRPLAQLDAARLPSFIPTHRPPKFSGVLRDVGTDEILLKNFEFRQGQGPGRDVILFVTYYADPNDKVPHTPEVCYRQSDTIIEQFTTTTLEVPALASQHPQIQAHMLIMRQPKSTAAIVYLFAVSGEFKYDREQVRWVLGRPGLKRGYFSKIEAISPFAVGEDPSQAIERSRRMLQEALPVLVEDHYPLVTSLAQP